MGSFRSTLLHCSLSAGCWQDQASPPPSRRPRDLVRNGPLSPRRQDQPFPNNKPHRGLIHCNFGEFRPQPWWTGSRVKSQMRGGATSSTRSTQEETRNSQLRSSVPGSQDTGHPSFNKVSPSSFLSPSRHHNSNGVFFHHGSLRRTPDPRNLHWRLLQECLLYSLPLFLFQPQHSAGASL